MNICTCTACTFVKNVLAWLCVKGQGGGGSWGKKARGCLQEFSAFLAEKEHVPHGLEIFRTQLQLYLKRQASFHFSASRLYTIPSIRCRCNREFWWIIMFKAESSLMSPWHVFTWAERLSVRKKKHTKYISTSILFRCFKDYWENMADSLLKHLASGFQNLINSWLLFNSFDSP